MSWTLIQFRGKTNNVCWNWFVVARCARKSKFLKFSVGVTPRASDAGGSHPGVHYLVFDILHLRK